MIVVMQQGASEEQVRRVAERLERAGFGIHISRGVERTLIGAVGDKRLTATLAVEAMEGVDRVVPILQPFKQVSREFKPEPSVVRVRGVPVGGEEVVVIAGPCSVESREQILATARAVKAAGARLLRGGAFKPRTSPYSFQGLELEGLKLLAEAREETGLPVVTEVTDPRLVDVVARHADVLQIGARNMQNYQLLREVGQASRPVLLKRGMASTVEEWLMAAEYIVAAGNRQLILCERGIRTFEPATRFTLDLGAVAVARHLSHLPILVDPSHAAGKWRWVGALARAGLAVGADGLIVEVHPRPEEALSDGPQSLNLERFGQLMAELSALARAMGRTLGPAAEAPGAGAGAAVAQGGSLGRPAASAG